MAPSEFDLRAALRDGEGEGVNPDHVIFAVERHRARRRSALLTAAAAVVVIAGGGVGISQLSAGSESGGASLHADSAGGAGRNGYGAGALAPGSSGNVRNAPNVPSPSVPVAQKLSSIACPSAAPEYSFSKDASAPRTASTPIFGTAVSAVVVCSYGTTFDLAHSPAQQPARLTLAGVKALALARSMEKAALYRQRSCANQAKASAHYAVIAVSPSGQPAGPTVSAQTGCNGVVTNGTAVRFNWSPPPQLARRLEALDQQALGAMSPSPTG